MLYHYYYFKCLQSLNDWKLPIFKNENFTYDGCVLYISWNSMKLLNSCKHVMRLVNLCNVIRNVLVKSSSLFFLKKTSNLHVRSITFSFQVGKMSIIWKIWNFHPWIKFHLGLAKPSWNFNWLYWVYWLYRLYWNFSTCNGNVILKRSLLFNRIEISIRLTSWNFNPGWKSSYNRPLRSRLFG